jgi:hypothetical protein
VVRNAGGIVTEDAIRSLLISQRVADTTKIMVLMPMALKTRNRFGRYRDISVGKRRRKQEEYGPSVASIAARH